MVEFVKSTDDKEKRNEYAEILVELMRQLNPNVKDTETNQKLWDDLFIMADFIADIDGPYPKPEKELLVKKPQRLKYNTGKVKYKHYGLNIELLIKQAMELQDPQEREDATIYIGRLMKAFHIIWNRENPDEQTVLNNIKTLSSDVLDVDIEKVRENKLFDSNMKDVREQRPRETSSSPRDRNRGSNKRNRSNQNRRRRN